MKVHFKTRDVCIIIGILIALFWISIPVSASYPGWTETQTIVGPVPYWRYDAPSVVYDTNGNWHMVYGWIDDPNGNAFLTYKNSLGEQYDIVKSSSEPYDYTSHPSLAISPQGDLLVMYRGNLGGINSVVKKSKGQWSKPSVIVGPVPRWHYDAPSVVYDSKGNWHMVYGWINDQDQRLLTYKNSLGEQYDIVKSSSAPYDYTSNPSLAISPKGDLLVMYRGDLGGINSTVKKAKEKWSKPSVIVGPVPYWLMGDSPSVVFDKSGTWHMMYGWREDPNGEYFLTYKNSLGEQYTPLHMNHPSLAFDKYGNLTVMTRGELGSIKFTQKLSKTVTVLLTFDDGPDGDEGTPSSTEIILDKLKNNNVQNNVKAAFFVSTHDKRFGGSALGKQLMEREYAEGHVLAIHTGGKGSEVWMQASWIKKLSGLHTQRVEEDAYGVNDFGEYDPLVLTGENGLQSDMVAAIERLQYLFGESYNPEFVRPPTYEYKDNPQNRVLKAYKSTVVKEALGNDIGLTMILTDSGVGDTGGSYPFDQHVVHDQIEKDFNTCFKNRLNEIIITFHDSNGTDARVLEQYMEAIVQVGKENGYAIRFASSTEEVRQILRSRASAGNWQDAK